MIKNKLTKLSMPILNGWALIVIGLLMWSHTLDISDMQHFIIFILALSGSLLSGRASSQYWDNKQNFKEYVLHWIFHNHEHHESKKCPCFDYPFVNSRDLEDFIKLL